MVKRAVLIGINDYLDPEIHDLKGCVADVEAMSEVLCECYQFDPANLTKLVLPAQNNRNGILAALKTLVEATADGDVALVYYSGHGSQVPDTNGDEVDHWDETIVPSDSRRSANGAVLDITDDELQSYILALADRTPHATFIFDSCHSGSIDRDLLRPATVEGVIAEDRPAPRATLPATGDLSVQPQFFPGFEHETGHQRSDSGFIRRGDYLLIAGCRDDEVSLEMEFGGKPHGLLTNFLIDELRSGVGTTVETIFGTACKAVEAKAKEEEKRQRPVLEGPASTRESQPFAAAAAKRDESAASNDSTGPSGGTEPVPAPAEPVKADPAEPTDNGDDDSTQQKLREWDGKFALLAALGILALFVAIGLTFGLLTGSVLDGQESSTKVVATFILELVLAGVLLALAGTYIALLDQRGRSHALQNVLTTTVKANRIRALGGDDKAVAGLGADEVKGVFEALGKMPTARGLIAVGGVIVAGAIALAWHVLPASSVGKAPTIAKQPAPAKVRAGDTAQFAVDADGAGLGYEWKRNGATIPWAGNSPTLVITQTTQADNNDLFTAVVRNDNGVASSGGAKLTVLENQQARKGGGRAR
jgi:hypothetical protein